MRKDPKQSRSRATVDTILEASVRVLVDVGYPRATTRRIADRAGVSIGSLYQFFSSKDEIYAAVLEAELAQLHPPMPPPSRPTRQGFEAALSALIMSATADLLVTRHLMRQAPHLIAQSRLYAQKPMLKQMFEHAFTSQARQQNRAQVTFETIYSILDLLFVNGWPPGNPAVSRSQKCAELARILTAASR